MKSHYFISYRKISSLPLTVQGSPSGWLAGKKSSSLRSGIFFRQALYCQGQRTAGQVRNRNTGSREPVMSN